MFFCMRKYLCCLICCISSVLIASGEHREPSVTKYIGANCEYNSLQLAVIYAPEIASNLIGQGANLAIKTKAGETLLHLAALGGHPSVVEMLVQKGLDVNAVDGSGKTPIYVSIDQVNSKICENDFNCIVRILIQSGADLGPREIDNCEITPLERALIEIETEDGIFDREQIVDSIISLADMHTRDNDGNTMLVRTARFANNNTPNYIKAIKLMLMKGTDVNAINSNGLTAIDFAYGGKVTNEGVYEETLESSKLASTLSAFGAERGRGVKVSFSMKKLDESEVLVYLNSIGERQEDINQVFLCEKSYRPLFDGVIQGHEKAALFAIEHGADTGVMWERDGLTALHLAVQYGRLGIVKKLLGDVDINVRDILRKKTALWYAIEAKSEEMIQILLKHQAKVSNDMLLLAAQLNYIEGVKIIVETGDIDINYADKFGNTASHYAAMLGNKQMLSYLEERGANMSLKNDQDKVAKDYLGPKKWLGK